MADELVTFESCPVFIAPVDGGAIGTWTPIGGTPVEAVEIFDKDVSYVLSTGINSEQWWQMQNVSGGDDTLNPIHRVEVTVCYRSDDITNQGGIRTNLGVGDATVGAVDRLAPCDYTCSTDSFDLNPNTDPPVAFTWASINDLKVGVTSLLPGDVRASYVSVRIVCGDLWKPCPRCCCCCMCFNPEVTLGTFTLGTVITGGLSLVVPQIVRTVPFQSIPGPTGGGCWYYTPDEGYPQLVATGETIDVYLLVIAIEAGTTNPETTTCSRITAQYYYTAHGDPTPLNTITIIWDTNLDDCKPSHESHVDDPTSITFGGLGTVSCFGAEVTNCPGASISCDGVT